VKGCRSYRVHNVEINRKSLISVSGCPASLLFPVGTSPLVPDRGPDRGLYRVPDRGLDRGPALLARQMCDGRDPARGGTAVLVTLLSKDFGDLAYEPGGRTLGPSMHAALQSFTPHMSPVDYLPYDSGPEAYPDTLSQPP
jgi:hypothetical protein